MIELTENHEYKLNDMIVPGVTTVLQDVGIIQNNRFATTGRGKRMHKIVQYFLRGNLDFSDITQEETELIEWVVEVLNGYEVIEVEKSLYNPIYHYAGTPDYIWATKDRERYYIVDLKTGHKKEKWHKIQLAAYQQLLSEFSNIDGLLLYQRTKEIEIITAQELQQKYFPVFRAALNVYNFKHGGK